MSAMALPGPWSRDTRGFRSWAGYRGRSEQRAQARDRFDHHDHRAEAPEPPRPPQPPWGGPGGPVIPGPPGVPMGPGGPFGPGGFGGFGGFFGHEGGPGGGRHGRRRSGPRAKRGDVRTGILLLLEEEPRSGYEIIREGRERSGGAWRPSSGSVYPMLQQLEDEGLIEQVEGEGRRRPYKLTDEGVAYLEEQGPGLTPPWEAGADAYADARSHYEELSAQAYQLAAAAAQVAQAGTPEQVEQAKRLLAETRRKLYLVLAEEDFAAPGEAADQDEDPEEA